MILDVTSIDGLTVSMLDSIQASAISIIQRTGTFTTDVEYPHDCHNATMKLKIQGM